MRDDAKDISHFYLGVKDLFEFPRDPKEAIELQKKICGFVITEDYCDIEKIRLIGGIDVAYKGRGAKEGCAVALIWDRLTGEIVEAVYVEESINFPYIPGLLSFRELPIAIKAFDKLSLKADLWMIDGAGIAHPRRLGIAAHFGVVLGLPAIGVAKSRLIGSHLPVPRTKGSWVPLRQNGEVIGHVLRTRSDVRPLYVSPGHKVSLLQSANLVLACCSRYRLPEPTRLAHQLVTAKVRSN